MTTVNQLLTQLIGVKTDIKNALVNKGVDMNGVPFTRYANMISDTIDGISIYNGTTISSEFEYTNSTGIVLSDGYISMPKRNCISFKIPSKYLGNTIYVEFTPTQYNSSSASADDSCLTYGFTSIMQTNLDVSKYATRQVFRLFNDSMINFSNIYGTKIDGEYFTISTGLNITQNVNRIWIGLGA